MSDELDRLRADLEVIDRYNTYSIIENARCDIIAKLEKLEAEADPLAQVKEWVKEHAGKFGWPSPVANYVRKLEADNAKLKAELDSAKNLEVDENGHFVRDLSEAEADPWADAKTDVDTILKHKDKYALADIRLASYVRHLESDNAKQSFRIAELEQNYQCEVVDGGAVRDHLRGLVAELESRPVPPLDPKRVIATACKVIAQSKMDTDIAAYLMQYCQAGNAGIYPLAGEETA